MLCSFDSALPLTLGTHSLARTFGFIKEYIKEYVLSARVSDVN